MYVLEKFILKIIEDNITCSNLNISDMNLNETLKILNHKLTKNTIISTTSSLSLTIVISF